MRQLSWKQRLALLVNAVPRDPIYPYGKLRCLRAGNKESLAKRAMARYCRLDVLLEEAAYQSRLQAI